MKFITQVLSRESINQGKTEMCYQTCDQHSSNCEGQGKHKVEKLSQTEGVREDMKTEGMWDTGWTPQTE